MNIEREILKRNVIYWAWFFVVIWLFVGLLAVGLLHLGYIFKPPAYFVKEYGNDVEAARWASIFAAPIFICAAFIWFQWAKVYNEKMQARFLM